MRGARGGRRLGALLVVGAVLTSTLAPPASGAGPWRPLAQDAACNVRGSVDSPAEGAVVPAGPVPISGWAADLVSTEGTGISAVRVSVDLPPDYGGTPLAASYGLDRPEVAELLGNARFAASGFAATWDATTAAPGTHVLYVQVLGPCGWTATTRTVTVAEANGGSARITAAQAAPTPSPAAGAVSAPSSPPPPATSIPPPTPTATASPSPTPPLPPPTNLTVAVNPFDGTVSLSWQVPPNLPTVRGFLIVANEADGAQRPLLEVPGSQTRAVLRGLNPFIGYSFSVLAVDSLGRRGAASPPVTSAGAPTTTPVPPPTVPPWCTPAPLPGAPPYCPGPVGAGLLPGVPPGYPSAYPAYGAGPGGYPLGGTLQLTATQTSPTSVQLSWTALAGASSYNVLQGLNGGAPTLLAAVGSSTAYIATLPPGGSATFQVQALGPAGQELARSNLSPTFTAGVGGGQVSAAYSRLVALSPNPAPLAQAASGVQVQVQARDANNLAVPNAQVLVQVAGAAVVQGATQLVTDAAGNAVVTLRGTGPGQATVTATINGLALPGLTYTFFP